MPVIDKDTAKSLLQISFEDDSKDAIITALIPLVQRDIIDYCNNDFRDPFSPRFDSVGNIVMRTFPNELTPLRATVSLFNQSISFLNKKITSGSGGFTLAGFYKGMDFVVEGSKNNDEIYQIDPSAEVTDGEISVLTPTGDDLVTEDCPTFVLLTKIKFPLDLKITAAQMIRFQMQKDTGTQITSERVGDWSASYARGAGQYPTEILNSLNRYRKFRASKYGVKTLLEE